MTLNLWLLGHTSPWLQHMESLIFVVACVILSCSIHKSVAERSYPMPEVRGGGQEEQPHIQGAVAAWVQEGREELLHVQGQEGRPCAR